MNEKSALDKLTRFGPAGLIVGLVGLGVAAVPALNGKADEAVRSYLFGWIFWICLTLGCLGIATLQNTVKAQWGRPIIRLLEAGASVQSLVVMGLAFIPIFLGGSHLYEFWNDAKRVEDHAMAHRAAFFNPTAFGIRTVLYFLIWIAVSHFFRTWSVNRDKTGDSYFTAKLTNLASPGLVIFMLTCTLAVTDWVMSINTHWFSTMYSVWFVVGMGLATMAFTTFVVMSLSQFEPYKKFVTPKLGNDLGNLLLMFTMLWAYTSVSQFLIIWSGNLPEFTPYYVTRAQNGWNYLGIATVLGQFFIPFVCLFSPQVKQTPKKLATLAAFIFFVRILDVYWVVEPATRPHSALVNQWLWADIAAFVGLGGIWIYMMTSRLKEADLIPRQVVEPPKEVLEHA